MFEYGKDIPLDGAVVIQTVQQGTTTEHEMTEGTVFGFEYHKDIPLDGVK